jgi:hypothetical protein
MTYFVLPGDIALYARFVDKSGTVKFLDDPADLPAGAKPLPDANRHDGGVGEAIYQQVAQKVYDICLKGPSAQYLAGGIAGQLMRSPLVTPGYVAVTGLQPRNASEARRVALARAQDKQPGLAWGRYHANYHGPHAQSVWARSMGFITDKDFKLDTKGGYLSFGRELSKLRGESMRRYIEAGLMPEDLVRISYGYSQSATPEQVRKYMKTYWREIDKRYADNPTALYNAHEAATRITWQWVLRTAMNAHDALWGYSSPTTNHIGNWPGSKSFEWTEKIIKRIVSMAKIADPQFAREWDRLNKLSDGNLASDFLNPFL